MKVFIDMDYMEYKQLPEVSLADIELLWHRDFYDGMLSGYCMYNNKFHYLYMIDEFDDPDIILRDIDRPWYRCYGLIEVPTEEEIEVKRRHRLFEEQVGLHTNYEKNERVFNTNKNRNDPAIFFNQAKEWPILSHEESKNIVAWFTR